LKATNDDVVTTTRMSVRAMRLRAPADVMLFAMNSTNAFG
jgi:hypothetical protein